jgi:dolichol-phosphate mannosyltransferase
MSVGPEQAGRPARSVYVVLPAFNEAACLERLLDRIDEEMGEAHLSYRVIVVDDGSRDATADIALACSARMPLLLMRHATNQGLGATLRDGLLQAAKVASPRDFIVTMDADDTHTPTLILGMVRMIREGYDVVVASRYQRGSRTVGVPLLRRILSRGASWLFRLTFPTRGVRDFTSGYRAYRADVVQGAIAEYGERLVDQDGFQCMVDILLKLRRMNLIFGEIPFILRYDVKEGGTKMKVWSTSLSTLRLALRRRFMS